MYTNFVELESTLFHTGFKIIWPGSEEEDFKVFC